VSDLHLDAVTMGVPRFPELEQALAHTVQVAAQQKVDAYVFLGDLCDPDSGPTVFKCVELAIRTARCLADAYGIRSYWLAGNHDVIEDGSGLTTLGPIRPALGSHGMVIEHPTSWALDGATFVALPFTATSHAYDPAKFLADHLPTGAHGGPYVVLSHLNVPGIIPGEETTEMPRGRDITLPLELLARPDVLVLQGHYHRQQVHRHMGAVVNVCGSLARLTHGEEEHTPGYLLCEVG